MHVFGFPKFICALLEVVIKVQSKDSVLDDDITENKRVKL